MFGVTDGSRTRNDQNHNLALYQLSYGHSGSPRDRTVDARIKSPPLYQLS